jgi:hypothetical protein
MCKNSERNKKIEENPRETRIPKFDQGKKIIGRGSY